MSLSVIHLSDIHIKNEDDIIFERIEKLKKACVSALPHDSDVVILISGDIAYSGIRAQYDLAQNLLSNLAEYIISQKSSRVHYALVPGNHDCDFTKSNSVRDILLSSVRPGIDYEFYKTVSDVQQDYCVFSLRYDITTSCLVNGLELNIKDNKILFLLTNTAWMSTLKEDPGKIYMPSNQFIKIDPKDYKVVFMVFHHPTNWLNPDYNLEFLSYIRSTADIVIAGHEHKRDDYQVSGQNFSLYYYQGKELQDSSKGESAFSVLNFDNEYQNINKIDFYWYEDEYKRNGDVEQNQFHKNSIINDSVFSPNQNTLVKMNDFGININHFAKDEILLTDLYVWPELNKVDYYSDKTRTIKIQSDICNIICSNEVSIINGPSSSGKTSFAKMMFNSFIPFKNCCLFIDGSDFSSYEEEKISYVIERAFIEQYTKSRLEDFRQLPKYYYN